jgi:hypothetical protein
LIVSLPNFEARQELWSTVGWRIKNSGAARVWWLGARALGTTAVAKGPDEGEAA